MKLYRKELIEFEKQWISKHPNKNVNPQEYIMFLDELNDIISKHDYETDERFATYGRRDFLRKEFSDYLKPFNYNPNKRYLKCFEDNHNRFRYYKGVFSELYDSAAKNGSIYMPFRGVDHSKDK